MGNTVWASFDMALKELARDIDQDFPSLEGRVVAVNENWGMVDLGRDRGVFPGMVFTVFRQGKPFYHPVTGALLGYTEDDIGVLQVVRTYPQASLGFMKVREKVKPGDGVRITAAKVNLYLFPFIDKTGEGFNLMAFTQRLRTYLGETNRFNIFGEEKVILTISSASEGGYLDALKKLESDPKVCGAALVGSIVKEKGDYYFKGDIISLDTGKRIDAFYVMLGKGGWRPVIERDLVFASPNWVDNGVAMGVGDLDGDGRPEVLLAFGNRLDLYRVDVKASTMKLILSFPLKARTRLVSLDVVDLDGDGKAEIVLSTADETFFALRSSILSLDPQKREWHYVVRGKEMFIRGYNVAGERLLLVQSISKEDPLAYAPRLARLVKGKIKKEKELKGLRGDLICGAQLVDLDNDGSLEVLVNEEGRVILKTPLKGEILWDTSGIHGNWGMAFFFRQPLAKSFYYEGEEFLEEKDYMQYAEDVLAVPGRSLVFKDGDHYKLALFTNQPDAWGVHFSPYDKSMIRMFLWRGSYFDNTGWIRRLQGGVIDIQAADMDGDGHTELLVFTKRGRRSREGNLRYYTRLLVYKVSP
jgi:hypothetical protein